MTNLNRIDSSALAGNWPRSDNSDMTSSSMKSEGTSPHSQEKMVYLRFFLSYGHASDFCEGLSLLIAPA